MLQRMLLIAVTLFLSASLLAAPAKPVAPATLPHPFALFLAQLSGSGKQKVTYRANAIGTYFFFEETSGVTVYSYDGTSYQKKEFMKGATLAKAMKKYAK
jgi:hypothetical protein